MLIGSLANRLICRIVCLFQERKEIPGPDAAEGEQQDSGQKQKQEQGEQKQSQEAAKGDNEENGQQGQAAGSSGSQAGEGGDGGDSAESQVEEATMEMERGGAAKDEKNLRDAQKAAQKANEQARTSRGSPHCPF